MVQKEKPGGFISVIFFCCYRLEKPTMSLVVWQPRETILGQIKEKESNAQDEEPRKRNGVLVDNSNNNDIDMWASGSNKWNMRE